jgi:beta-N-acetylhexosaminidase
MSYWNHSLSRPLWSRLWRVLLAGLILLVSLSPAPGAAQNSEQTDAARKAADLLARLTPEERVGQLFLITFRGAEAGEGTEIHELITKHYIGGVVLLSRNDNFTGDDTPRQVNDLTRSIQLGRWNVAQQNQISALTGDSFRPNFVPLFVALPQESSGTPYEQILSGMTPLPNPMALGATWNSDLSRETGKVLGQELNALGINLFMGPSLDILESPRADNAKDLGTRTFGGDPFWVAEMSSAFIEGLHEGSANQLAVVGRHFPGHGSADRLPEEEVATIRRSLEQLRNFDLVPFFAVTGNAPSADARVDGLLTSHVRYQGFQGNIRDTTRPVSLDPQALLQLIDLPAISSWRSEGGVMISDNLGSQAIGNFYKLNSQEFDPMRVAHNAFRAGNDLLYIDLSEIAAFTTAFGSHYTATAQTIEYFVQRYREDAVFAQLVDASVLRILTLKYRLYPEFRLDRVLANPTLLESVGQNGQVTFETARQSATLISPGLAELTDLIPDPPNQNDRLLFLTDTRLARQCSTCNPRPLLDVRALQQVVLRRYGPQVSANNMASYTMTDLQFMLDQPSGTSDLENDFRRSHWIIFSMLDASDRFPSYQTLRTFLLERPDLFQGKRIIVFAFNAPYYLDSTNISKLTAYYGMYSHAPQFVDVAAYLLFRDFSPTGALPVSVSGVYDLNQAIYPDPRQVIPLEVDLPPRPITDTQTTPEPFYQVGELMPIRTGVIIDHNGHRVPDGIPVTFVMSVVGDPNAVRITERTQNGIARATFQFNSAGLVEIRAETETSINSAVLRFEVQQPVVNGAPVTVTPQPSPTVEQPTPTPTQVIIPTPTQPPPEPPTTNLSHWLIALIVAAAIATGAYRVMVLFGHERWGLRSALLAISGGLLAYTYLAFSLPGSAAFLETSVAISVFIAAAAGALFGLFLTWLWRMSGGARRQSRS